MDSSSSAIPPKIQEWALGVIISWDLECCNCILGHSTEEPVDYKMSDSQSFQRNHEVLGNIGDSLVKCSQNQSKGEKLREQGLWTMIDLNQCINISLTWRSMNVMFLDEERDRLRWTCWSLWRASRLAWMISALCCRLSSERIVSEGRLKTRILVSATTYDLSPESA